MNLFYYYSRYGRDPQYDKMKIANNYVSKNAIGLSPLDMGRLTTSVTDSVGDLEIELLRARQIAQCWNSSYYGIRGHGCWCEA